MTVDICILQEHGYVLRTVKRENKFCEFCCCYKNALNFLFLQNPSNFSIFIVKENPHSFFPFFILCNFEFYPMNVLVYVDIDQGIYKVKLKVAQNETQKNEVGFLFL